MSNSKRLPLGLFCSMLLSGCAAEPAKPSAPPPPPPVAAGNPAPAAPAKTPTAPTAGTTAPTPAATDKWKDLAGKTSAPFPGSGWQDLFDGQSLVGWRETPFAGHGEVKCESGLILLGMGDPFTGINCTNPLPNMNYEVALDAARTMGSDFFCGLTVPVGDSFCSLIVGGWGGSLVGISSLDSLDASENETTKFLTFQQDRWYRIRLRITPGKIEAWIDNDKVIDVATTGRKIGLRPGDIEHSKPFGIAAWQTASALREIRWRKVEPSGR